MSAIQIDGQNGSMVCFVSEIPAFPGETIAFGVPEAIGDVARSFWFGAINPTWEQSDGCWLSRGEMPGELSYRLKVSAQADFVDVSIELRNESDTHWEHSHAFNCINAGSSISLADHDCRRHWACAGGKLRRLIEIPRVFGPRPTIQLYSVEGAPKGAEIPFVARFASTPADTQLEGWLAIQSGDGKRLMATVSKPALYLFQNMEYSCIHSAPDLGALAPGETGSALTRVYFVESSVEEWHARMRGELFG
jgi:hypothetical protein